MDYIPSIFQFDQALEQDDLLQSCIPWIEHTIQDNYQLPPTPTQYGRDLSNCNPNFVQKRKVSITFGDQIDDQPPKENKKIKKIMHRDIERHRRQAMATLYASLRSHLPIEYLKGKRSISDHVHQAANYIKHLQNNIQEMHDKKDELERSSNNSCSLSNSTSAVPKNSQCPVSDSVVVRPCRAGVEVVVNTPMKQGLPLSKVLHILIGEGLGIVSCISTQVNERLLHTIESEVSNGRSVDMSELQQRLSTNEVLMSLLLALNKGLDE